MSNKMPAVAETATAFDPSRSPTVYDVAREVGCSIATVSRALNQPDQVRPAKRQRIVEAVGRLGYVPNGSARTLRSAKSRLMGAVIPTLSHAIYARMIQSLQSRLAEVGVSLLHVAVGYDLKVEAEHIRLLLEQGVEGVVLVGAHHRPESFRLLRDREVPFIVTYALGGPNVAFAGFDNFQAGAMAARYLADLGHRRLAMLAGVTKANDRAAERKRGFVDTAEKVGIARDDVLVCEVPYRMDSGQAALALLLDRRSDITGVFCGSDILAIGAMKTCRLRGLRIPEDLSIIGFDNLEFTEFLSPALTTIAIPAETMGARAADFLLSSPEERPLHARAELQTQLIVRDTTAPPRLHDPTALNPPRER